METAYSNETWVDVRGYEGYYQVSNCGRVRSVGRYLPAAHGSLQFKRGQMISQTEMPNGYLAVGLYNGVKRTMRYVHRLVAEAFVENQNDYNEVNHKDEVKTNNKADNLEWCSHAYNIRYGTVRERISKAHIAGGYGKIPVAQFKEGLEIARFDSAADAERETGIDASAIRKVCLCRPRFKTAGGYQWKSVTEQANIL